MMGGYERHYEIHAMIGKQFTRIGAMPLNMIEGACLGPFLKKKKIIKILSIIKN